jgi:uncharacterized peroxidase-related enzyme
VARSIEFAEQVAVDYTKAGLNKRERVIADFTVKVTRSPNTCSPLDIETLHDVGLTDNDVLCLVEIIAYQNMSTRIMESLSTIE